MDSQEVLLEVHGDVREMRADLKHALASMGELRKDYDDLEKRVDDLEREKIRIYAWATGLATSAFFILDWLKDRLHLLVAVVVYILVSAGCATLASGCDHRFRWEARPVQYVVDQDMRATCLTSAVDAVAFWEEQGVDYLVPSFRPSNWYGFVECPRGAICVTEGKLSTGIAGTTWVSTYVLDRHAISSANIVLANCHSRYTAAHELGHALGLYPDGKHNPSDEYLMWWAIGKGHKVSEGERAWVQ